MWIETTDGGLVNSELATGVQAGRDGNRYKVDLEVVVLHQSRNSMRTIFISEDETEFKAFMDDLKTALPMLPIGDYKLLGSESGITKPKAKAKATPKSTPAPKPPANAKRQDDPDEV